jgi:hypothetical protein
MEKRRRSSWNSILLFLCVKCQNRQFSEM